MRALYPITLFLVLAASAMAQDQSLLGLAPRLDGFEPRTSHEYDNDTADWHFVRTASGSQIWVRLGRHASPADALRRLEDASITPGGKKPQASFTGAKLGDRAYHAKLLPNGDAKGASRLDFVRGPYMVSVTVMQPPDRGPTGAVARLIPAAELRLVEDLARSMIAKIDRRIAAEAAAGKRP